LAISARFVLTNPRLSPMADKLPKQHWQFVLPISPHFEITFAATWNFVTEALVPPKSNVIAMEIHRAGGVLWLSLCLLLAVTTCCARSDQGKVEAVLKKMEHAEQTGDFKTWEGLWTRENSLKFETSTLI